MKDVVQNEEQLTTIEPAAPPAEQRTLTGWSYTPLAAAPGSAHRGCLYPRQAYRLEQSKARFYPNRERHYALAKRGFDIAACVVSAPLVLPLVLICAIGVRVSSPGPILFRQRRTGQGGRSIEMLKFRSMVVDAEERKAALKESKGISGPDFKMEKDPRITWVGSLMRKTSLDELPQLWNVLRGDMSLVGPRPTSFGVDTYESWHAERLEVKPGLTGLWQIKARGDLDFDYRVRLDIAYVRQRSLALDFKILAFTVPCVIAQRGAY